MNNSQKILKMISGFIEAGLITSKDLRKELLTSLKFKKEDFASKLDLVTKDEFAVIKKISDETSVYEEGCLSIPDTFIEIERPKICEVEYIDLDGKLKNIKCDGLLSTCLQHEINHLDGKLIIDHLTKLKRDIIIKKISKNKKNPNRVIV